MIPAARRAPGSEPIGSPGPPRWLGKQPPHRLMHIFNAKRLLTCEI